MTEKHRFHMVPIAKASDSGFDGVFKYGGQTGSRHPDENSSIRAVAYVFTDTQSFKSLLRKIILIVISLIVIEPLFSSRPVFTQP